MCALGHEQNIDAAVPVVRLAELPALASALARNVREGGFSPDSILYIETGARLFAHELAGLLQLPLIPIWVQRTGHSTKRALAPMVRRLPVGWRDWLRKMEERSGIHRHTARSIRWPDGLELQGRRVLLVDDAADTGRTIELARESIVARGVPAPDLRTAVLAATTPAARGKVDFYVLDRNCRMPWSADSEERAEAAIRAAKLTPSHAPRDF